MSNEDCDGDWVELPQHIYDQVMKEATLKGFIIGFAVGGAMFGVAVAYFKGVQS